MQARTKIRFDAVDRARKLLETAPAPEIEEVTKSHAVRILIPQILDAHSKGYSMEAITRMLSESGVVVSVHLVKNLIWRRESEHQDSHNRTRKRGTVSREDGARARQRPASNDVVAKAQSIKGAAPTADRSDHEVPLGGRSPAASNLPPNGVTTHRRSTFVPRPDTKDI